MQSGSTSEAEETARQTGPAKHLLEQRQIHGQQNRRIGVIDGGESALSGLLRDDNHGNLAALARSGRSSTAD